MNALYNRFIAKDRWIGWLFVLFFVVLTLVEIRLITFAVGSYNGLVTERAYPVEMPQAEVLERDADMATRGWQLETRYEGIAEKTSLLELVLTDATGAPLSGVSIGIVAERVTRHGQALPRFPTETSPGLYTMPLRLPLGGAWTLRLTLSKDGVTEYRLAPIDVGASGS
ncbi:FixH family protein [Devosia sp. 63-57]|uniref:FixH family protein n=1 Tax=Devosia sp. 63-57 TaxID=1895751 RepID=UPI00086CA524|nr:FixH family protein [Devosia sp. 63-57]ODT51020.1 MAG: hypothetical protein ABS74_02595 [Pelagibacterium sp. SCN 63-126]ODU84568.1 MAG: hypothetical protein ABT14_14330 [Pelagibacterium sp. SCN 63-17]OJX44321.1 MAG: hypothetical protein BGO80_01730 [Devosia sp. 63-57]